MAKRRTVSEHCSIFDLLNYSSLDFPNKSSIRIMYEYDGIKNTEKFTVLSRDIPEETKKDIISWLEENIATEDIIYGLDSNKLDIGKFPIHRAGHLCQSQAELC